MSFFDGPKAKSLLGIFGDAMLGLAGQPGLYGPAMMKRRQDKEARTQDWADWEKKEQYKRAHKTPDVPELAKTVGYYRSIGRDDIADDLEAKGRMVPVQQADPNTGEVRYQYVRPTMLMGGGSSAPMKAPQPGTVEDGYMFKGGDPSDQSNWVPVNGGAGPSAPRPFR